MLRLSFRNFGNCTTIFWLPTKPLKKQGNKPPFCNRFWKMAKPITPPPKNWPKPRNCRSKLPIFSPTKKQLCTRLPVGIWTMTFWEKPIKLKKPVEISLNWACNGMNWPFQSAEIRLMNSCNNWNATSNKPKKTKRIESNGRKITTNWRNLWLGKLTRMKSNFIRVWKRQKRESPKRKPTCKIWRIKNLN